MTALRLDLRDFAPAVDETVGRLVERRAVARLWERDHTVVQPDPAEVANRLEWLAAPSAGLRDWPVLVEWADAIVDTVNRVVLCGMGGSSLFPDVLARCLEPGDGFPRFELLDSTHPASISAAFGDGHDGRLDDTLVLVSSKSGSTVETRSQMEAAWVRATQSTRFAAVTDPGSSLAAVAAERRFDGCHLNEPNVGGRFSALTKFGLVPAALLGLDAVPILDTAEEAAAEFGPDGDDADNPAVLLGAVMAAAVDVGRPHMSVLVDPRLDGFGAWLEQLVAESTGKHGRGVVPLVDEELDVVVASPERRFAVVVGEHAGAAAVREAMPCVSIDVDATGAASDLGALVFLWELATAVCGVALGINPFDQPDVESAKVAARQALAGASGPPPEPVSFDAALELVTPGDHVAVCAFVAADSEAERHAREVRDAVVAATGVASSFGIGPRFLHSTGQLHKGGDGDIVVMQVVDPAIAGAGSDDADVPIPGEEHGFGALLMAQANGDLAALRAAGKRAARLF